MRTLIILASILFLAEIIYSQDNYPAYRLRVGLQPGIRISDATDPGFYYDHDWDWNWGYNLNSSVSMLFPISFFNLGFGIGATYMDDTWAGDDYSGLYPEIFALAEFGNAKKHNILSGIILIGVKTDYISKKELFYFGIGPSINFGSKFKRFNVSLHPNFQYYHTPETSVKFSRPDYISTEINHYFYNIEIIFHYNIFKHKN